MTRILAFSDIHNNLRSVEILRAQESNAYDAVLVAGDIGSESLSDFLDIVSTFDCPIYFVYGNWDNEADYTPPAAPNCHLVHHSLHRVGSLAITGFSGCPTHWGQNPIYVERMNALKAEHAELLAEKKAMGSTARDGLDRDMAIIDAELADQLSIIESKAKDRRKSAYKKKIRATQDRAKRARGLARKKWFAPLKQHRASKESQAYETARAQAFTQVVELNRQELDRILDDLRGHPTIVLTHERIFRFADRDHDPIMHVFGHRHTYKHTEFKGVHNVNVAALDIQRAASFKNGPPSDDTFSANMGGYSVFEIRDREVSVHRRQLILDEQTWKVWNFHEYGRSFTPGAVEFARSNSPYLTTSVS